MTGIESLSPALERLITMFDSPRYARLAVERAEEYRSAGPFPHIVIDDFLPAEVAEVAAAAYPDPQQENVSWRTANNANTSRRLIENAVHMNLALRLLGQAFNSRQMLLFLEVLSGIECLLADPYFIGGGAMLSGTGDFLKAHADFNWHWKLQAHRRLNALLYLTPGWQPEWRGDLELFSADGSSLEKAVEPKFNRLIVFTVGDEAYHGQPTPLETPEHVYRRVFSAFYYTTHRDDAVLSEPHFTKYAPSASTHIMALQSDYKNS